MGWMDTSIYVLRNFNINAYYYIVDCDRIIVTSSSNGLGKNKDSGKKKRNNLLTK